ncbi:MULTISPECIES: hypothetical protein [Polyangium]|uniref:Uncharacterized protein n=2 Tax=Polyangium TaxID=55 RepID=A0A4U1IVJ1_9BACT|nr:MULTISPECIES: hypothetical protein [Polyangium]MDI1428334.1 hypothetical protein [Polyangium sorediatum]TKC98517.1 hypothetical protein E8A74_40885 [Polyangium fumosum]
MGTFMERMESAREGQATQGSPRKDLVLAGVFTAVGLGAVIIGRGGLGVMIAGSIGSVAASVVAVGLAAVDPRLSYRDQAQAGVCIVLMMLLVGFLVGDSAFFLAGYPLLALGVVGLLQALRAQAAPGRSRAFASSAMRASSDPVKVSRATSASAAA